MYVVIEFDEEDANKTAVVRSEWLTPKKNDVFWPPYKLTAHFNKALNEGTLPNEQKWSLHRVRRCLYSCDDLLKARQKEREAERESDLQSELDGQPVKRRRKTNPIFISESSSEDDAPVINPKTRRCLSYNRSETTVRPTSISYPTYQSPPVKEATLLGTPQSDHSTSSAASSGLTVIANRLAKVELEIVKLKEYLEDFPPKIVSNLSKEPGPETVKTASIPPLPCNEKEDVDNLEEWLEVEQNQDVLSLALMVEKDTPALLTMANRGIPHLYNHQKTVFVTAKAKEILFEGIYLNCTSKDFAAVALCTGIRMNAKGLHKINDNLFKFSFFGVKNGTADEARLTVKRGKENIKDLGRVVALNGKPEMKVWEGPECNQITGTDTTIFPPFTQSSEDLISFSPDVCRSMGAKYQRPSSYKGIKTNYYTANLGDMSKNAEEKCFCPTPTTCHKKGIFDITKCTGAPIWLSLPHFYETDPFYLSQVEGLSPEMDKHQIFVEFEPFTGTPLAARKRMQFNIPIHKIKKIELMRDLPDALIPIFWIEEGLELGQEYIDLLENKLFRTMRMVGVARWVMLIVGLAMIGFGGYSYFANTQTVDLVKQPAPPAEKHSASSVSPRY